MNKLPPALSFGVLCGASLVLWFRPLLETFALAIGDDKYTHILLILPVVIALIFQGWSGQGRSGQGWRGRSFEIWAPAAGLLLISVLILIAGAAGWGSRSDLSLAIEMIGLVGWWISSFLFSFGRAAFRSFLFPLCFLFWMVPIPKIVLDPIVASLQQGSILAAQWLFSIFRVPVSRDGTVLAIPGLDIDVTPECSSIRSSLMLLVTTMLISYVLLKTPWRRALVIAVAVPLSVAKNGLRIFTIGMLGTRVDASYLTGHLHRQGGVVFFLVAMAMLLLLLWILRRSESGPSTLSNPPTSPLRSTG